MIDLNKIWIDFECPKCDYSDKIQLIDAKTEKIIFCHNCKIFLALKDETASVHSGITNANNALKDIETIFKTLGR